MHKNSAKKFDEINEMTKKLLTSEQLRVIYRLYKSVMCTAEFIFLNKHGTGSIKKKRFGIIFLQEHGTGSINNHLLI